MNGVTFAVISAQMRRIALLVLTLTPLACSDAPTDTVAANEMQTIHTVAPRPAALDQPAMLMEEAPPPKPKLLPWETATPIVFSAEDEKLRASLPFTPAIAMDAVDGSKISIRAATPTFEYKGKIYYFTDEANKRIFLANPEQYTKGGMMRL
jgi:YHS domain-containing protein